MKALKVTFIIISTVTLIMMLIIPMAFDGGTIHNIGKCMAAEILLFIICTSSMYCYKYSASSTVYDRDLIKYINKKSPTGCRRKRLRRK